MSNPSSGASGEPSNAGASDPFSQVPFDPQRFRVDMQKPGARKTYGIYFTPRSGSSWLTDMIRHTGRLGKPEEWFNPRFLPRVARSVNADNLMNCVKMLKRKQAPGGIFGFELTYYQMLASFGSEAAFLSHFPPRTRCFFLIREDIVLQAVSLAKSVATSVYHSANSSTETIERADHEFQYDAEAIEHWLGHVLDQETRFERFFAMNGIHPVRISYEMMIGMARDDLVGLFAEHLGEELGEHEASSERHRKIGTAKNNEFAARFAQENAKFLRAVARRRTETLSPFAGRALSVV